MEQLEEFLSKDQVDQLTSEQKEKTARLLNRLNEENETLNKKDLGYYLKVKREAEGLTRNDIQTLTGVSLSNISRLETGKLNDIKISNLIKVASAYDVETILILNSFSDDDGVASKRSAIIAKIKKIQDIENMSDEELLLD